MTKLKYTYIHFELTIKVGHILNKLYKVKLRTIKQLSLFISYYHFIEPF